MRLCLILIAVLGSARPAWARASAAAAADEPTTVSGLVVAVTRPTAVGTLTVTPLCPMPRNETDQDYLFDPLPGTARGALPGDGAKAAIERAVALIKHGGRPGDERMPPGLVSATRRDALFLGQQLKCLGDLDGMRFLHVTRRGLDDYRLDFRYGALEWAVSPPDARNRVRASLHRLYAPQPVTREFESLLSSLQQGAPDYADLTPALAADIRVKWPRLQARIRTWGGLKPEWGVLKSLFFVREEDDGSYVYMVSFGRHRLGWKIATVAGKIDALTYVDIDDGGQDEGPPPAAPDAAPADGGSALERAQEASRDAGGDAAAAPPAPAQASAVPGRTPNPSGPTVAVPKTTDLSGVEVTVRRATDVSAVTVTPSCRMPSDSSWPDALFDAPKATRHTRLEPSAGTREWALADILMFEDRGTHNYAKMGDALERVTRQQLPIFRQWVKCLGKFKAIRFLHVSIENLDDYELSFSNGAMEWAISPLENGGILNGPTVIRYYYPQPTTRQFDDLVRSIQKGSPNLENLTPELGVSLQNQWPSLQKKFIAWGKLSSRLLRSNATFFVREETDGSYTYVVSFGRRKVGWNVVVSADTGKIAALTYADPPD